MDRHLWSNPDPFRSVCYHFVKIMIEKHTCKSNLYYLDYKKMDRNEMDRTKGKTCMVWNILYLFGMVKLCYEMITNGPEQIREKEKHV